MALVVCSEARNKARSMFLRSPRNAIGQAAVKHSASAGNDIDVIVVVASAHRCLRCNRGGTAGPSATLGMTKSKWLADLGRWLFGWRVLTVVAAGGGKRGPPRR